MGELFERTLPETPQSWSGERLTSATTGQVEIEHLHRYFLARELCRGLDVLDVACGEGYGSMLLAQVATTVVGVDVSPDTVAFAEAAYRRPNLQFLYGDARHLPLPDGAVDVVVSFETIEHFYEHDEFIAEVKRVLRPGGSLVISSPERDVYSPVGGPVNAYHVRELTRAEFDSLLRANFQHASIYAQRPILGSALMPEAPVPVARPLLTFERRDDVHFEASSGLPRPMYLIAIASDSPIVDMAGSLYIESSSLDAMFMRIAKAEERANELSEQLGQAEQRSQALEATIAERDADRRELAHVRAQIKAAEQLARDTTLRYDADVSRLKTQHNVERAELKLQFERQTSQLTSELESLRRDLRDVRTSTSWRLTRPLRDAARGRPSLGAPARLLIRNSATIRRAGRRVAALMTQTVRVQLANGTVEHGQRGDVGSAASTSDGERDAAFINAVNKVVPSDATLVVATLGKNNVVRRYDRRGWHFPQMESGASMWDSTGAIANLEGLRTKGGDFLIVPDETREWFEALQAFHRYIARRCQPVLAHPGGGLVFSLGEPPKEEMRVLLERALGRIQSQSKESISVLDWHTHQDLASMFPQYTVFAPPAAMKGLPYLEDSVDVVAIHNPNERTLAEARRVAKAAVIVFTDPAGDRDGASGTRIEWMCDSGAFAPAHASVIVVGASDEGSTRAALDRRYDSLRDGFQGEVLVAPPGAERKTAAEAAGEVLVFVDSRVLPVDDCIPTLVETLTRFGDAGVVGGRLVGSNGRLVGAGGTVRSDGTVQLRGAGHAKPDDPAFRFVRQVDWCSRNLFATWHSVFEAHLGFDSNLRHEQLQDADYCFRVRRDGRHIYYQPDSVGVLLGSARGDVPTRADALALMDHWKNIAPVSVSV